MGIHTRGALIARRLRDLIEELLGRPVPLGEIDISFYRDDVGARRPAAQPVVHSSRIDFPLAETTVVLVDDVLYTGRTARAGIEALFDYGRPGLRTARGARRPRPPGASDPPRLRGKEPADLAVGACVRAPGGAATEWTRSRVPCAETRPVGARSQSDEASAFDRRPGARATSSAILEIAESFAAVADRDIKKVPTLRGRTVVNLFYEASTRTSSSFELAAKRLSADLISIRSAGSAVDKGESLKDTVATLSAYDPAAIVIRSPWAGPAEIVARRLLGLGRERRRRQARAPEPGAARPLHAPAAASGSLEGARSGSSAT